MSKTPPVPHERTVEDSPMHGLYDDAVSMSSVFTIPENVNFPQQLQKQRNPQLKVG